MPEDQPRIKKWLGPALAMVSVLATIGLVEAIFRVSNLFPPASQYRLPPLGVWPDEQSNWDLVYRLNALGLRDLDRQIERVPQMKRRIVIVGDSFVFGQGVRDEQIHSRVLERLLRERGVPAEVINVSNMGLDAEGYHVLLRDIGLKFQPDVVVVTVFGNDASKNDPFSIWQQTSRDLAEHSNVLTMLRLMRQRVAARRTAAVTGDATTFWDVLEARCAARDGADVCRDRVRGFRTRHGSRVNNLAAAGLSDRDEVWRWTYPDLMGPGWRRFERYITQIVALCRTKGVRLVLAIVPDGPQVDPDQVELRRSLGLALPPSVTREPGSFQLAVAAMAERLGVDSFDPLDAFRVAPAGLYYPADLHWTPEGHHLYARELLRFLESRGLL